MFFLREKEKKLAVLWLQEDLGRSVMGREGLGYRGASASHL